MPLPWKKVKNTRISQLVNDHLHKSQKRRDGSSLVVETGFPTSLIDLFIKNREKLKKPSKKKRQPTPISPLPDVDDPVIMSISPPSIMGSPLRGPPVSPLHLHSEGVSENTVVVGSSVGLDEGECGGDETGVVDANTVLLVVLKMFVVVVLALGTKRLTVGITISAFLLCFLEYVGKHVCALMKPCSVAKRPLKSTVRRVSRLLRFKVVDHDERNDGVSKNHGDHEIQVVESNRYPMNHMDEIKPEHEIIEVPCYQRGLGYQEIESNEVAMIENEEESVCEVVEMKSKSRRAKIRSKIMKKLVPKKLRCSRKEHESQMIETVRGENRRDERVVQYEDERESDNASDLSSVSCLRHKEDDKLVEVNVETVRKSEGKGAEIVDGRTWGYLLVLCAIVLAGLIGGRAFAVLLTLSWFLVLKLRKSLPMDTNVPIIKTLSN